MTRQFNRLLCALLLYAWTIQPALALDLSLPDMGNSSGSHLGTNLEAKLGRAFMRYVRAHSDVVDDPLIGSYLESVGNKLARHSDTRGRNLTFFAVEDPSINAFAGPDGYIGVHTGLILEAETESELAAVMAHEIAHVGQRHLARMIEATNQMSLPMAGLLLAAIALGAAGAGSLAAAAAVGSQAALVQKQINFTRANEREADNIGIRILARSEYDPRAMASFFDKLGRSSRTGAVTVPEFLQTHPVSSDRIAEALGRSEKYPLNMAPEDLRFHLVRATLRSKQFGSSRAAIRHFESTLKEGRYRNEEAERYGYVQALFRGRQYGKAMQELNKLLGKRPRDPYYRVTRARIALAQGNKSLAISSVNNMDTSRIGSHAGSLLKAEVMLQARQPASAYRILNKLSKSHSDDAHVMRLLGRAAAGSGKTAESHRALAEYHYLNGELDAAVKQLGIALRTPGLGFHEKSKLEARLREIDTEIRAIKKTGRSGLF
ncbi:MAG: M48 family metalloprotease [Chromatiales bacterium]|jgi:predicted Zn-dependent protease